MAHRVDAAMQSVKAPGQYPSSHRVVTRSGLSQLSNGDHTVLPSGDSGDQRVGCGA